ncbi:hypothetical protein Tco_1572773, partial [Tanacetum coccineum]
LIISQDLVHTAVNSLAEIIDYQSMEKSYSDEYNENLELRAELSIRNDMVEKAIYSELSKKYARLDLEPLSPKLLQNKEAYVDYLKYTLNIADILCEIVDQDSALNPLDSDLDSACRYIT